MGSLLNLPDLRGVLAGKPKLENILRSRVLTGFLRRYADSQFCSESLSFIQAVNDFEDLYPAYTKTNSIEKEAKKVFDHFIDNEKAETQICLTSDEYSKICERMKAKNFSHKMFHPLLDNPILTVENDIFPRFRRSEEFREMCNYMENPIKPYLADIRKPPQSLMLRESPPDLNDPTLRFTFNEVVLEDSILCEEFLTYLDKNHCGETLRCLFEIKQYKQRHEVKGAEKHESRDRAFAIYFRFLNPGSAEEVSVHSNERHYIAQFLASENPPKELFDRLEHTLLAQIKDQQWIKYTGTAEYANLVGILREKVAELQGRQTSKSCLIQ